MSRRLLLLAPRPITSPNQLTGLKLWLDADQPVGGYLSLPGTSGNYASTPDSAALSITGDIDIRVKVAMNDWTPALGDTVFMGKYVVTGSQKSWLFTNTGTGGALRLYISANGSSANLVDSSVATGFTDGSTHWVRATWSDSGDVANFYTSEDGITWVQLGAANRALASAGIFDSTAAVEVGSFSTGTAGYMSGNVYYAEVRNGINGTIVAAADFNRRVGTTSFTDGPGNVWTINGASSVFVNDNPAESSHLMAWRDRTANLYDATQTVRTAAPKYLHPGYLRLPGTSGNYASTPDAAALDVVGDIDIRCKVAADDWTPGISQTLVSKWTDTTPQRSFLFRLVTNGTLQLNWSADGTASIASQSTAVVSVADGSVKWVRVTLDVDNGAAGNDVKFYTSDDGITWTQLGTTVTTVLTTSIFNSTAGLIIGAYNAGSSAQFAGNVYYADVRNNILGDGTGIVAVADFEDKPVGTTTWTGPQGNVWTVNGASSAFVKTLNNKPVLRFDGVDDQMSLANLMSGAAAGTGFVVLRVMADPPANGNQGGGPFQQWGADNSNLSFYPFTDGKIYEQFGVATRMINFNASPSLTNPHVYGVISAPSDGRIYLDGALLQSVASTVGWGTNPRIGGRTGNPFLTGDIAEVIVYDRALQDRDRKSIERYLALKYRIL